MEAETIRRILRGSVEYSIRDGILTLIAYRTGETCTINLNKIADLLEKEAKEE